MAGSAALEANAGLRAPPDLRSRTPGNLLLRARIYLRRHWLDREIARASDRSGNPALTLREAQLTDRGERRRLARRLERVLAAARTTPAPGLSSAVPIDRRAVRVAAPVLTELILSLRSSEPISARGVVLCWNLLTEATSPVYAAPAGLDGDPDRLWYESLTLLFALKPLARSEAD